MSKFKQLNNFHSHSADSLDGASTVDAIVAKNAKLGATHCCLTEHGNLNSAMELYTVAPKYGMKPVLGIELYLMPPDAKRIQECYIKAFQSGKWKPRAKNPDKIQEEIERKAKNYYFHLTVHFKTYEAYQHFCRISPKMNERAVVKFGESKPMATIEEILSIRKDITLCSSCLVGIVSRTYLGSQDGVIPPDAERAEKYYCMLRELVGKDNFFVEIFPHKVASEWVRPTEEKTTGKIIPGYFKPNECTPDLPDGDYQKKVNLFMLALAAKYGDKPIVSLDSHFADKEDKVVQDSRLSQGMEAWKFANSYHIMPSEEAFQHLNETLGVSEKVFNGWIENSYDFASLFNGFKIPLSKDRWLMPEVSSDFMSELKEKIDRYGRMNWSNPVMVERLKKEVQVIAFNGSINLMGYLFTVEDIANFCKENDILINVRGSAGGCFLLYLLGVSAFNPIDYNLQFERFMTEGRIKSGMMMDADLDVSDQERVFEYLKGKYGDGFLRLSTEILMHLKSSIRDVERYFFGSVRPATEKIVKNLPSTPSGITDEKFVFGYIDETGVEHKGLYETNPTLKSYAVANPEVWNVVRKALGIQRNRSTHACGIVLLDRPAQDYLPVISIKGTSVAGFSPKFIETAGCIKYDVLGVNTLRDIKNCLKSIKERTGVNLDIWNLPYDEKTVGAFISGKTETVFQFDSPTVRPYLTRILKKDRLLNKLSVIKNLSYITSLCRPGCLDAPSGDGRTLAEVYVARANGEPTNYIHPDLEPILKDTFGIQIGQEQTLQIFRNIGGLTYEEAETCRKAISKKDAELLGKAFGRLSDNCIKRGWTKKQIDLLIDQIFASSRYSFNLSHSTSYGIVAYACMYLKENYPLDWWKATLSNASRDELAAKFWRHVRKFTELPQITDLTDEFKISGDKLIAPFSTVSGLGPKTYQQLLERGPYTNIEDFTSKHFTKKPGTRNSLSIPLTCKMIIAGILDPLFASGMSRSDKIDKFLFLAGKVNGKKSESRPEQINVLHSEDEYLIKKQLIKVYSEDLRYMLLNRGGKQVSNTVWQKVDEPGQPYIFDGDMLDKMKEEAVSGIADPIEMRVIAYVVEEKAFPYHNKTKQATKLVLDVNGHFSEEIFWPRRLSDGEQEAEAPIGFKDLPCLVTYDFTPFKWSIKSIQPLLNRDKIKKMADKTKSMV